MVAAEFQRDLIKEVETILKDVISTNTSGETVTGVKGYKQFLPIVAEDDEDESQFFPYFIVRVSDGKTEDDDEPWMITTDILFGIVNQSKMHEGHEQLLHMIELVVDRFVSEPLFARKYRANQDIEWAASDEDTFPFFFGGVRIKFSIPKIGRRIPDYENYI